MADRPTVLFVCVHNAGRSQMAAALLHHHAQGRVSVLSAGSEPADRVNPAVLAVMNELGLDLSQEFPKPLTDASVQAADVVVTMGCGDACPFYPGKRYLDWELEDPAGKDVDTVRRIRDDIDRRVRTLLASLSVAGRPGRPDQGQDADVPAALATRCVGDESGPTSESILCTPGTRSALRWTRPHGTVGR